MHYLNEADINSYGRFDGPADSVAVNMVPTFAGTEELLVLVGAEGCKACAAIRVRDLVALTVKHYPALVAQACAASTSR